MSVRMKWKTKMDLLSLVPNQGMIKASTWHFQRQLIMERSVVCSSPMQVHECCLESLWEDEKTTMLGKIILIFQSMLRVSQIVGGCSGNMSAWCLSKRTDLLMQCPEFEGQTLMIQNMRLKNVIRITDMFRQSHASLNFFGEKLKVIHDSYRNGPSFEESAVQFQCPVTKFTHDIRRCNIMQIDRVKEHSTQPWQSRDSRHSRQTQGLDVLSVQRTILCSRNFFLTGFIPWRLLLRMTLVSRRHTPTRTFDSLEVQKTLSIEGAIPSQIEMHTIACESEVVEKWPYVSFIDLHRRDSKHRNRNQACKRLHAGSYIKTPEVKCATKRRVHKAHAKNLR